MCKMFDKDGNISPEFDGREIDYNNDIFLKMCHKAEELQKQWVAKKGDRVYYYYHRNLGWRKSFVTSEFSHNDEFEILEGGAGQSGGHFEYTSVAKINRADIVWLPSQERLQQMYRERFVPDSTRALLTDFKTFVWKTHENTTYAPDQYPMNICTSMKQLWLCFWMDVAHNKRWNGEDWVKGE